MTALPTAQLAVLAALRGDEAAAHLIGEATAIRAAHPGGLTDLVAVDLLHWARGLQAARQPAAACTTSSRSPRPGCAARRASTA